MVARPPENVASRVRNRVLTIADGVRASVGPRELRRRARDLQRKVGVTRSGVVALAGGVVLWVMGRVVAGTAMYLAAYGVVLLLFVSYLLAARRLRMTGERAGLYPRVQQGSVLDVEVTLTAQRRISTFLLEEHMPEVLGRSVRVPVIGLGSGSTVSHRYGLRCGRRGVYEIGPLVAVTRDPLGLVRRESVVAEPFELLVHPRMEPVSDRPLTRRYEDPPIRPPVSKPFPSGLEFYGMREYTPGDDLRRIVWRAVARTGKLLVRDAEQGITDHITLILDTDASSHSRDADGTSESFETAIRVAASLGARHVEEGYEVRCETNDGPLVRPLRGAGMQLQLLDSLARLELQRVPLERSLMRLLSAPSRDAHNVLITPHLGERAASQLKLLMNRGVSVLVVALRWDPDDVTIARSAALGCQVVGVGPNDDLTSALHHAIGAGSR